jgi:hypothetical protein
MNGVDSLKALLQKKKQEKQELLGDKKYVRRGDLEEAKLKRIREEEEQERRAKVSYMLLLGYCAAAAVGGSSNSALHTQQQHQQHPPHMLLLNMINMMGRSMLAYQAQLKRYCATAALQNMTPTALLVTFGVPGVVLRHDFVWS